MTRGILNFSQLSFIRDWVICTCKFIHLITERRRRENKIRVALSKNEAGLVIEIRSGQGSDVASNVYDFCNI